MSKFIESDNLVGTLVFSNTGWTSGLVKLQKHVVKPKEKQNMFISKTVKSIYPNSNVLSAVRN